MAETLKKCEICHEKFSHKELYPISLMRHSVLKTVASKFPDMNPEGFICHPDMHMINAEYYQEVLREERGALSDLEKEVLESLREHDVLTENVNEEYEEQLTFGERLADKISSFGGSWYFIGSFAFFIFIWMVINSFFLLTDSFDPYPYILLNLILSTLAAIQAPVIMMSQNRQAAKDRLQQEHDYRVNLKAELQTRQINARLDLLMKHNWQKISEMSRVLEDLYRERKE